MTPLEYVLTGVAVIAGIAACAVLLELIEDAHAEVYDDYVPLRDLIGNWTRPYTERVGLRFKQWRCGWRGHVTKLSYEPRLRLVCDECGAESPGFQHEKVRPFRKRAS